VTEKANPDVAFGGEARGHPAGFVGAPEPTKRARNKSEKVGVITPDALANDRYIFAVRVTTPHARLASSRWSIATGRAFHPQDSNERFQICILHLIPLSQASWRNLVDRVRFDAAYRVCNEKA
jgi:hypothetical protein